MTCDVLLKKSERGFVATVVGVPGCIVEAATRDDALEEARRSASQQMAEVEVVQIDIEVPTKVAPLNAASFIPGTFANESPESWNEFLTTMKANRLADNVQSELSPVGPGMWKDNPLFDEFLAAMKAAREEIDNNPNRL